jgi:hypothetical protein
MNGLPLLFSMILHVQNVCYTILHYNHEISINYKHSEKLNDQIQIQIVSLLLHLTLPLYLLVYKKLKERLTYLQLSTFLLYNLNNELQ